MRIVIVGAPGVGKGTYADILKKRYNLPKINTGDLIRDEMAKKTEVGLLAKKYYDEGNLVPDDITIEMLKKRIIQDDCKEGFILDGFPRTIPQAEALEKIIKIDKVINFFASDEIIIQRLSGRRICRNCKAIFHVENIKPKEEGVCDLCKGELYQRDDDKPEAIKKRLEVYRKQTAPLIGFYKEKIADVDANRPFEIVDEIIADCDKVLGWN